MTGHQRAPYKQHIWDPFPLDPKKAHMEWDPSQVGHRRAYVKYVYEIHLDGTLESPYAI